MQTRPFSSETSYLLHQKKTNYGTMCRHKTKQVKRPPQKEEQPIEKRSFLEKTKRWLAHPLSSPKGHSPLHLHIAIEEGNIEIVKALIQAHPKMIKEKNKYYFSLNNFAFV